MIFSASVAFLVILFNKSNGGLIICFKSSKSVKLLVFVESCFI